MTQLTPNSFWTGPGYRDLTIRCTDNAGREYALHIPAREMQRLILACADAVGQIGTEGPIDWERHPQQIYWPQVTPWRTGPRAALAKAGGA